MTDNPQGLFQLYRASAGSGKTYSLVKMFLLCCLAHPKPTYFRHILAITFTNKAAGEMKARVLRALSEMSEGRQEELFEELHRESKLDREKLREQIRAIHKMMLHRYGELSIMTIDKFVNRLVRSFTKDLGLNADYRIELNQGSIVEAAVDRLLSEVGQDEELTKVLEEYVLDLVEDEKSWKIRDALSEFGQNLFREKVQPVLDEVKSKTPLELLAAQNKIKQELFTAKSLWVKTATDMLELIESRGLQDAFSRTSVPNYLRASKARNFKPLSPTLQKEFLEGEFSSPSRVSEADKAALNEITPRLLEGLEVFYKAYQPEQMGRFLLLEKLNKKVFQMAVLGKLEEFSMDHQEVENIKTFSDLNKMISDLVRNNPVPFIYERIGQRYHHFLIDEFQDTSVVQWQNLMPLFEDSLAQGHVNLIVGDGKQAIYRWRNGDVEQFQKIPNLIDPNPTPEMKDRERVLQQHYKEVVLGKNFRSQEEVVNFNNSLFDAFRDELPERFQSIFDAQAQEVVHKGGGFVSVQKIVAPMKADRHDARHKAFLSSIEELQEAGFEKRDIALLFRTNKQANSAAKFLLANGITPITEESLLLKNHVGVLAVINYLEWLVSPNNEKAKVRFVTCYNELQAIQPSLVDVFEKYRSFDDKGRPKSFDLHSFIAKDLPFLNPADQLDQPLYHLVEELCDHFGLFTFSAAYAEALLQLVLEYSSQDQEGLDGFVRSWDQLSLKASIRISESADGVRLLTIHKAKGLEFPVVLFPVDYTDWWNPRTEELPIRFSEDIYGLQNALLPAKKEMGDEQVQWQFEDEVERKFLDAINTTYVATTRAEHALYLYVEMKKSDEPLKPEQNYLPVFIWNWLANKHQEQAGSDRIDLGTLSNAKKEPNSQDLLDIEHFERGDLKGRLKMAFEKEEFPGAISSVQLGDEMHLLLSRLLSLDDLKKLKNLDPWMQMETDQWNKLIGLAEELLNKEEAKMWFDGSAIAVHNEQELRDQSGKIFRPDRIVEFKEEFHIIDYKTGVQSKKHLVQVQSYMGLLNGIEDKPVRGFLLYLQPFQVVEVTANSQTSLF